MSRKLKIALLIVILAEEIRNAKSLKSLTEEINKENVKNPKALEI